MRILILVSSLTAGGEQRVASLWAKGFVERGHEVSMVLGCSRKMPKTYNVPKQTKIYHLQNVLARQLYKRFGIAFFFLRGLHKIIEESQPDTIISLYHPWTEWAAKVSKGKRIHIISTEHTTFERPDSSKMSPQTYQNKYIYNKQYDYVTVLTEADKRCLKGHIEKVAVMPNPLPFAPANEIPTKEKIILSVGQLHSWYDKGLDILIEAWGKIASQHPDWKLQIAGLDRNNSRAFLRSIADRNHIGNRVEFIGFRNDMLSVYKCSSIFVLSSRYEGFGMALIEAMSQGCACIACDYKGRQHEIIGDDHNGILCPTEDVDALADALQRMLDDKTKRLEFQRNARDRSKHFSLDSIMNRWDKIFEKVFSENVV